MTIFELFPWQTAFCVTVVSAILLKELGVEKNFALFAGIIPGVASWLMFLFFRNKILPWLERKEIEKDRGKVKNRQYQAFDPANCPTGKNLFYECSVCGNAVPSTPKKDRACKCGNVLVHAKAGRVEIQNYAKTKLLSP